MISLTFPKPSENMYLFWNGTCYGPFDRDHMFSGERVSFRSKLESMKETPGIFHENNVEHESLDGNFFYHPILNGIIPVPTAQRPYDIKLPIYYHMYNGGPVTTGFYGAQHGLAVSEGASLMFGNEDLSIVVQKAYFQDPLTGLWTVWQIEGSSTGYVNAVYRYDFLYLTRYNDDNVNIFMRTRMYNGWTVPWPENTDWSKLQSFEFISHFSDGHDTSSDSSSNKLAYFVQANSSEFSSSPHTLKEKIDMLLSSLNLTDKYPIEDVDYGDLAMEASSKVLAIKTNMIAFLNDFRHPADMIPKLNNLKSLRGLSNDYLTVKYGILPTISDLEKIKQAFSRMGPYIDKNGFSTYSAGSIRDFEDECFHFQLVQHIKLAIGDEDSLFEDLISRLDKIGLWPTLNNVWDLIPYTFIVDWFVDVGNLLQRMDASSRIGRYNIQYATMSRKAIVNGFVTAESAKYPFVGRVTWVQYHRWVSDQCPTPPLSLKSSFTDFNHWLESGALITQRAAH